MGKLDPMFTVSVRLTAEQHNRILELVYLMDLDPDEDFEMVAQGVIMDSLDRRIESSLAAQGRRGFWRG